MRFMTIAVAAAVLTVSGSAYAAGSGTCHAMLSQADAKELAAATPNARAFHDNLGAVISTSIAHTNGAESVAVRVMAREPNRGLTQVGVYTVSLRTGHVTDDDMEPAEDDKTVQLRERLTARHCGK